MEEIEIHTEFIRLDAFLKFCAAAGTGGEAKNLVQDGRVKVNGELCAQRTRKLRPGDRVSVEGQEFAVTGGAQ